MPVVALVNLVDFVHIVGSLGEGGIWRLLVEGVDHELNPVVKLALIGEERKEAEGVAHVEDLGNEDQFLEVQWVGHVLDGSHHVLLQNSEEAQGH